MSDRLPKPKRIRSKRVPPTQKAFSQPELPFMDPWVHDDTAPSPLLVLSIEDRGVQPSARAQRTPALTTDAHAVADP